MQSKIVADQISSGALMGEMLRNFCCSSMVLNSEAMATRGMWHLWHPVTHD